MKTPKLVSVHNYQKMPHGYGKQDLRGDWWRMDRKRFNLVTEDGLFEVFFMRAGYIRTREDGDGWLVKMNGHSKRSAIAWGEGCGGFNGDLVGKERSALWRQFRTLTGVRRYLRDFYKNLSCKAVPKPKSIDDGKLRVMDKIGFTTRAGAELVGIVYAIKGRTVDIDTWRPKNGEPTRAKRSISQVSYLGRFMKCGG